MTRLFADTYALVEILKGNPAYKKISEEDLVTLEFNIFELAYALYRDFGRDHASGTQPILRSKIEIFNPGDLDCLNASEFRTHSNKNDKILSLIDSLGCACSKRLDIRFLTGDQEFKDVENVEYIK